MIPCRAKQPGAGPPLGYRLRLNCVYKVLETRLFVRVGSSGPLLGKRTYERAGSRRAPRRWRQGDPYLARGPEKGLLRRPFSTNGGSWASSKIISDSESFVRSLAPSFVRAGFHVLRLVFSGPVRMSSCSLLTSGTGEALFLPFYGPSFRARRINDRKSARYAHGRREYGTIEINCVLLLAVFKNRRSQFVFLGSAN